MALFHLVIIKSFVFLKSALHKAVSRYRLLNLNPHNINFLIISNSSRKELLTVKSFSLMERPFVV